MNKQISIIFTIIFFLAPFFPAMAKITEIDGKVVNGEGFTIRLMTYKDQVSYQRITLQSDTIRQDELFSLSVDIDSVTYCWLDLEFQHAEIFIQPGQHYEVALELRNTSLSTSYYNRTGLPIKFVTDDQDHLNISIQDFNQLYNDFLLNLSDKVRSQNSRNAFETFLRAIDIRFQNNHNTFFRNYIWYKTASMQLFMRLKSRENIGLEYFTGKPVLYGHLEYMDFFHLYFEKYFITGGKYFSYNKTYDLINGGASIDEILDSLHTDPVLNDINVRELLLLDGLKELYNISGFKRGSIMVLINEIAENGESAESRDLAMNLIDRLKRLQPGSPAPDFMLSGVSEYKEFRLSDFSGKYIYLAFFDSGNLASQSELGMVTELYEKYNNKVAFVAVSVDKDTAVLKEYLTKASLPWLVLHYGGNLELLENYDASSFPSFLLIDDKGTIFRCPAPSPSENIQKLFDSF